MADGKTVVGVFDSGVGGLSVLRELERAVPEVRYVYYADTAHCPYGEKPAGYVLSRAREITEALLKHGAEVIVIACNTATSAAIAALRREYGTAPSPRVREITGGRLDRVAFIGMEPAVKPAALVTRTGVVGVLATAGTLRGGKYLDMKGRWSEGIEIVESVGRGFVELVEGSGLADRYRKGCLFLSSAGSGASAGSSSGASAGDCHGDFARDCHGDCAGDRAGDCYGAVWDRGVSADVLIPDGSESCMSGGRPAAAVWDEGLAEEIVKESLAPLIEAGAETVVLGCTHYPFLLPVLEKVAETLLAAHPLTGRDGSPVERIRFIDPAPAVAHRLIDVLREIAESSR